MITKKLNIVKKNLKYFAAINNGYSCKVLIDANSANIPLGESEFLLEDISVRSKWGTDVIFKIVGEQKPTDSICTLKHVYNSKLVEQCHNLGGKWDAQEGAWVFSSLVADKVEILDSIYNSEAIAIEITAIEDFFHGKGAAEFLGYPVARATGRDSGAKLGEGFSLISGGIRSGGSMKNWGSVVKKGSVLRFLCPRALLTADSSKYELTECWSVKEISE